MVITDVNIPYLFTKLRRAKITSFLTAYRNKVNIENKKEMLKQAFQDYLKDPSNTTYKCIISKSPLYDNGECSGLVRFFYDAV